MTLPKNLPAEGSWCGILLCTFLVTFEKISFDFLMPLCICGWILFTHLSSYGVVLEDPNLLWKLGQ